MSGDIAFISLMEQLCEPGFRSSVIATYNCYFPFYEEVVLRKLITAGSTHNVLLVDARHCSEAFASEDLRPRRAGRDYTLIPVRVGGAFHPKICLCLGKSKGSLLVGSHNLTLAGFGLNDEVTNVFSAEGSSVRAGGGPLRLAFDYLSKFVPSGLPEVVAAFESLKLGIPWMDGPLGTGDPHRVLLMTLDRGPDLWSQVVPRIPRNLLTAFACAPFFDPELAFVRRLRQEIKLQEMIIGIDPSCVEIDPYKATAIEGVRWVNIAGVASIPQRRSNSHHRLHAKLLWFQGENEELLVTGSANLSAAAFFSQPSGRNAEAVVCDHRIGAGTVLGIEALLGAPEVSERDWAIVADRRSLQSATDTAVSRRIWLATPRGEGFCVEEALPLGVSLVAKGDSGLPLGLATVCDTGTEVEAPFAIRDSVRYLEGSTPEADLLVIVHRTEDIARNIGGDVRKALRQALGALEEDPGQIDTVLKLAEKVIFDSEDVVRTIPLRTADTQERPGQPFDANGSLALDATGKKSAQARRRLASGDIVIILDALIRRLGEGLVTSVSPSSQSDESEIGADDENGGEFARDTPEPESLAKMCRGKIRRLIRRMEKQFELTAASEGGARRGIVQLAAVLGVVRMLRTMEQRSEWRRRELALIEPDDKWRLFEAAVLAVTWGGSALGSRALAETDGEWFDELSFVIGLLAWLGWDVEVDAEKTWREGERQDVEGSEWYPVQLLAALGQWLCDDESAVGLLEESVARTPRVRVDGRQWVQIHRALLEGYAQVVTDPDHHGQVGRSPRSGDLAVLSSRESPRVRVVLDVRPGKDSDKIVLFDPNGEREFVISRVASLQWPRVGVRSAVSA